MKEHRSHQKRPLTAALFRRITALALAAALALGLTACQMRWARWPSLPPQVRAQTVQPADGSSFSMDFIDVGQALSVLITCDGQSMLYDGGNVEDGSLVVSYLQGKGVTRLEYVFAATPTRTMWAAWRR